MRIKILLGAVAIGTFIAMTAFAGSTDSIRAQARSDANQYYNEHKSDPGWHYDSSEVYNYSHRKAAERGFTMHGDDSVYASGFANAFFYFSGHGNSAEVISTNRTDIASKSPAKGSNQAAADWRLRIIEQANTKIRAGDYKGALEVLKKAREEAALPTSPGYSPTNQAIIEKMISQLNQFLSKKH
jgi:hypothetical protein